jgi:phosphohistidine phosphatase
MKLYFLRHAEAEDGPVDAERALTRKGRRDARSIGKYLCAMDVRFDHAFTSPLVRAVQTAELTLKECPLRKGASLTQTKALLNEPTEAGFLRWLKSIPGNGSILLVGHDPSLSAHVRHLAGMQSPQALNLPKGAVARVDTEDRKHGELRLLISPKHLP